MSTSILQRRARNGQLNKKDGSDEDRAKNGYGFAETKTKMTNTEAFESSTDSQPELRRAGSSTLSMNEIERQNEGGVFTNATNTLFRHLRGMTNDFQSSGLPWEGYQCRSLLAGGSGILYAMPVLVPSIGFLDGCLWTLQAILSITADYINIHHRSIWHGIDRYFATCNFILMAYRAGALVHILVVILVGLMPLGCYLMANRAKNDLDLAGWHRWHFGWHLTGSQLVALIYYLSIHCPDTNSVLKPLCFVS